MIHQTQLTVIIPTFRREEGLKRALESLLDEQISSMEILVIDDSPEQSAREVVASFEDCRIRYLAMEHPSGGHPALVRNFGIDQAKGELLYFLDDDDHVIQGGLPRACRCPRGSPERWRGVWHRALLGTRRSGCARIQPLLLVGRPSCPSSPSFEPSDGRCNHVPRHVADQQLLSYSSQLCTRAFRI